jgi:hypothetical protein
MNVPNPTAITFEDDKNWMVFVFTEAVTASGMALTWSGLTSKDGVQCYATITEVQAWTGECSFCLVCFSSKKLDLLV